MSGKIIVIEGGDCCGKTSVAKSLAAKTPNGVYYHNPAGDTEVTNLLYGITGKHRKDIDLASMRLLQIAGNSLNQRRMRDLKREGKVVFCDRSILSTVVYQEIDPEVIDKIMSQVHDAGEKLAQYPFHIPADHMFVFHADLEVIAARMEARGDADDWDRFAFQNMAKIQFRYLDYAKKVFANSVIVDTSKYSIKDLETFVTVAAGI